MIVESYHDDVVDYTYKTIEELDRDIAAEEERCRLLNEGKLSLEEIKAMGLA